MLGVLSICYLTSSNLQLMRNKGVLLFNTTNHVKGIDV